MRIHPDRITVSPSSVTSRMECSEAHALRYRDGHDGAPSMAFSRGKAADTGIESYYLSRLADPDMDPVSQDLIDTAVGACAAKLADEQFEAEKHIAIRYDDAEVELWQGALAKGIPLYIKEVGQYLRPIEVQGKVEVKIGEILTTPLVSEHFPVPTMTPVYLAGYPDFITEGLADVPEYNIKKGGFYIDDLKTGMKKGLYVTNEIQLLCYQAALWSQERFATTQIHKLVAYGPTIEDPHRADCKISIEQLPYAMDEDRFEWLRNIILGETRAFLAGARSPSGVTGFGCKGCSQRFNCQYYDGIGL